MQESTKAVGHHGEQRYRDSRRITVIGAAINLLLALVKIVSGVVGQSQALIADGVHSLSDLISDFVVTFAARHGSRGADAEHPYGHGRVETVGAVVIGVFLAMVAAGIAYDAAIRLFDPGRLLQPTALALAVAALSILFKEFLYHYTMRTARRLRSELLRANAWHHRSDAISSVIVVIGIGGTMAGLPYLDAIAAVGVALMIAAIGWRLVRNSVSELIDTALEPKQVTAIRKAILGVDGVNALHLLRTRRSGADALVDVHILVDPALSVSEAHLIGETVRSRLIDDFDEISDVTVHIDPEDDERSSPPLHLPARERMLGLLREAWQEIDCAQHVENVTLHYLDGKVHVEVVLPLEVAGDAGNARRLAASLTRLARRVPDVGDVRVYFH
jgi:cation diffusion facilitator family transporter